MDAILGTSINFVNIDGEEIRVDIPKLTQNGDTIRIKGKGFPKPYFGRGDLILKVKVTLPSRLSEEEKALLEKLREFNRQHSVN